MVGVIDRHILGTRGDLELAFAGIMKGKVPERPLEPKARVVGETVAQGEGRMLVHATPAWLAARGGVPPNQRQLPK